MPSLVGLGFHPPPGRPKTLSFFMVALSNGIQIVSVLQRLRVEIGQHNL